ncbi:MAG: isoaspartyl peptidase/L-asparaginase [Blastocatellia bacterium]|nr:isoaspartyl peptidase/L-asparaginase [Blastocatellia bacterium]
MLRHSLVFCALATIGVVVLIATSNVPARSQGKPERPFRLAIHGGAGTIDRTKMTAEREAAYRADLERALRTGHAILAKGGSSLDAVEATLHVLEDSPLFNAGKGAVFTHDGHNELDASIMDGATGSAGAVAGVRRVRNPISLARLVMEKSPHVMMVGTGAETFAREHGVKLVDPKYFWTEHRWKQLQEAKRQEAAERAKGKTAAVVTQVGESEGYKFGTVGAVALDQAGNLAAGTSTGGMTNKRFGRVGDAPIIGAGTYASNATCAVSATGHGEYFIRSVVGYDISALMEYKGMSVADAANEVVMKKLVERGGEGGVIAMDRAGNIAMPFNTTGMYRGWIDADGKVTVAIYKEP